MRVARPIESMSQIERLMLTAGPLEVRRQLGEEALAQLKWHWPAWCRPSRRKAPLLLGKEPGFGRWTGQQEPTGKWIYWIVCGGRGYGKSRVVSQFILDRAWRFSGCRIALVARTTRTLWNDCVEGDSGIIACAPPWFSPRPRFNAGQLVFPNESKVMMFTAEEPDNIRGPNNDFGVDEELCAQPRHVEAWKQLQATLRKGRNPQAMVATTPRPIPLLIDLLKSPLSAVTVGSSYENAANVAESWLRDNVAQWEGTAFGRQEIEGEVLESVQGALFDLETIEQYRLEKAPELKRIVVAVDPARMTYAAARGMDGGDDDRALAGILVVGEDFGGHFYVLEDASVAGVPAIWAAAVKAAWERWSADCVVYETNHGGRAVEEVLREAAPNMPLKGVNARRGKYARAEPVSLVYRQGRVHHVGGFGQRDRSGLVPLEEQMCSWTPASRTSPDRMDALVYGLVELAGFDSGPGGGLVW